MKNPAAIWQQIDTAIYGFIFLEADVGMTFAQAALQAYSTEECLRNRRVARQAYDTARSWMSRGRLTDVEARELRAKLLSLKEILHRLGDPQCGRENLNS